MTPERKQEYTRRITQANRTEIIVITYEIALDYIADAQKLLQSENVEGCRQELVHAAKCVEQLLYALDYKYPLSYNLLRLYNYMLECIRKASYKKDQKYLTEPVKMLKTLHGSFEKAAASDTSGPMMGGADEVYEGLTYNAHGKNCTSTMRPR